MSEALRPQVIALRPPDHEGAVPVAMRWLADRHRKAWRAAFEALVSRWRPGGDDPSWNLGEDGTTMLSINVGEWLLARGRLETRRGLLEINELLRGPSGPCLTAGQQRWIAQLREQPLRLYRVTDVRRGEGLTLLDELDGAEGAPRQVREVSGSRSAEPGMLMGARLMQVGEGDAAHLELSGAIYPFSRMHEAAGLAQARAVAEGLDLQANEDRRDLLETAIARTWLAQWFAPRRLPQMRDSATGEALLLVTDHYRVLDAAALAAALQAQADVHGDAARGWTRIADAGGGMQRALAAINPGQTPDRVEVFCRTQGLADGSRAWLDEVAGASLQFMTREIVDPSAAMSRPAEEAAAAGGPRRRRAPSADLSPDEVGKALTQVMQNHYANWCDEPIPALGERTPRQAIATAAGLERVKGLLREYEHHEQRAAAEQGRPAFSFQFLWQGLGIAR